MTTGGVEGGRFGAKSPVGRAAGVSAPPRSGGDRGLTLIEMLVAIAVMAVVMGAAYATVQDSLKLHRTLFRDTDRIVARCRLAERLTADLRGNRGVQAPETGRWQLTRADGARLVYTWEKDRLVRDDSANARGKQVFEVGPGKISFSGDSPASQARVKFADGELIIGR